MVSQLGSADDRSTAARQAGTLSGKRRQMLVIGRALMSHPRDRGLSMLLAEQHVTLTFEATRRCLMVETVARP